MLVIISPAKKMVDAGDSFAWRGLPRFLPQAGELLEALCAMSYDDLKTLWACSDALASLNYDRVQRMNLADERFLTPAVFSYEGIQYQNMAPQVMTAEQLEYLQAHLRILSGFYGVLRPFDGVTPYRLEMQAKLAMPHRAAAEWRGEDGAGASKDAPARNLYEYWGSHIYDVLLADELASGSCDGPTIVNLASVEYAKAVEPYVKAAAKRGAVRYITCLFGSMKNGKFAQRSTEAKAARGTFVRWCAENVVERVEDFVRFNVGDYRFAEALSSENKLVFVH